MALKLPKNAEKKATGFLYLKEEGLYKVVLVGNEDAVDEKKESKRKGYNYHFLKFQFENNRTSMARIYYQNEEGDIVPEGYNFLLALTNIAKKAFEDDERLLKKLEDADSNQVIGKLIKEKVTFYVATKNSIYQGNDATNINTFIDPLATLEDAEEFAEKRKMKIVDLLKEEKEKNIKESKKLASEEDDDDDDDDDL
jgi:hypothetical protein